MQVSCGCEGANARRVGERRVQVSCGCEGPGAGGAGVSSGCRSATGVRGRVRSQARVGRWTLLFGWPSIGLCVEVGWACFYGRPSIGRQMSRGKWAFAPASKQASTGACAKAYAQKYWGTEGVGGPPLAGQLVTVW